MAQVAAYHRPDNLDQAIELLAQPGRTPLAGGTVLNADREPPAIEVVDLQALGLGGVDPVDDGSRVRLGAMATLADLLASPASPDWLRDRARAELPSTLRPLATIGGTVAAGGSESVLLAALLAAGGVVDLAGPEGPSTQPLADLLATGVPAGSVLTAVTVAADGEVAVAATGRTPADVPIVAAVAHTSADGTTTLALTGVAASPVLAADPTDPAAGLDPPGDFRGSPDYRRHLAATLGARAVASATSAGGAA